MAGFISRPGFGAPLYQPVIWDKLAQERGIGLPFTTEGARPAYPGGGSPGWKSGGYSGYSSVSKLGTTVTQYDTPSNVSVRITKDPSGRADVIFHNGPESGPPGEQPQSTKNAISRLGEVFNTLKHYVQTEKPSVLTFEAATPSHAKVYDKVVPHLASQLGGVLEDVGAEGFYRIKLK